MVVLHDLCENDLATSPISATEVADLLYVPATIFTHTDTPWLPSQLYLLCALTLAAKGARKTSHHFRNMANFDGVGGTKLFQDGLRMPVFCSVHGRSLT